MGWIEDHYLVDEDGFESQEEYDKAVESGDIKTLFNGCGWDSETGDEYWPDGSRK